MLSSPVLVALAMTLVAGMATGIGSGIAFFARRANYRFLAFSLAFSSGVMIFVSFVELLAQANETLGKQLGARLGPWAALGAFFGGVAFIALIDVLVPHAENPHEPREEDELRAVGGGGPPGRRRLLRLGLLSALAITIHNFPEGMATFLAALDNPRVGLAVTVAIALHNIPEGISVSVPIFYATGNRRSAFVLSLLSGLAEPLGALAGYAVLRPWMTPTLSGVMFAAVAGIMVFISLDELLPTAHRYGKGHDTLYGIVAGMAVMGVSLLLMR